MTMSVPKIARRAAIAMLLVLIAAGTVFAAAATLPAGPAASLAQRAAGQSAEPSESAEPTESPDVDQAKSAPEAAESPEPGEAPEASEAAGAAADASPSAANLARIVDRLTAAGITTTAADLATLAKDVGVGGAVRVLLFAKASGKTPAEILAMFDAGKGWGVIARELKLDIGPGIGSVMGQGHGHDAAKEAARAARAAEHARRKAGAGN